MMSVKPRHIIPYNWMSQGWYIYASLLPLRVNLQGDMI